MKLNYKFGFKYCPFIEFDDDKYFISNCLNAFHDKESVDWLYNNIKLVVEDKWEDKEIFDFGGGICVGFVYADNTYFYNKGVKPDYEMRTSYLFEIIQEWRDFVYNNA